MRRSVNKHDTRLQMRPSCLTAMLFWESRTWGALGVPLLQQLLWQVTSCCFLESGASLKRPADPLGPSCCGAVSGAVCQRFRPPMLSECEALSVGGVCQLRGLGCNYSQWLTADYISANVTPSASILMERGCIMGRSVRWNV